MAIGRVNTGGGSAAYAFVIATFPAGSTVSCTNSSGNKDLSATQKLFYLKKDTTTCTVTATKDGKTATKAVTGITEGSSTTVALSYEVVLFENGQLSSLLGSLKNVSLGTYAITDNKIRCVETGQNTGSRTGYGTFTLAVDLTDKENLYITAAAGTYGTNQRFGVAAHGSTNFTAYANKTQNGSETITIPVGELTGSYDIVIAVWAYGDYSTGALTTEVNVSKIWAV